MFIGSYSCEVNRSDIHQASGSVSRSQTSETIENISWLQTL